MYPTWRYHATKPACIVKTPDEEAALGAGWADHPDKAAELAAAPAKAEAPASDTPRTDLSDLTGVQAAALIAETDDVATLQAWFAAEHDAEKPRKGVLSALTAAIDALTD